MFRIKFSFLILAIVGLSFSQEPLTGSNPPAISITASTQDYGYDSVVDSLQSLRFNIDKAQAEVDSLTPASGFSSAGHRAAFYQAAAQLKKANVSLFSYMAQVDPNNRYNYLAKARQSKRQADLAMVEYYKALPAESPKAVHFERLKLDIQ
jgi:hypothetical protein